VIAHDPVRLRPIMLPAMFDKFSYVIAATVFSVQSVSGLRSQKNAPLLLESGVYAAAHPGGFIGSLPR
jgi:hypothetical protein